MPDTTARLSLPILAAAQAQKHVTHNEALQLLDGVTQLVLTAVGAETPPALPVLGNVYALGAVPSGAWAGQGGRLAQWQFGQWLFFTPQDGWRAWDQAAGVARVFQAGIWLEQLQNLTGLGIGTASDTQNRLAVAAPASLLTHAGAGHQLKINKAASGESASLLYQSAWAGHAEMGLTGDDNFHLKTSADGTTWTEALVVDAASGVLSGAGVQASGTDPTAGRLMAVGAFGLGNVSGGPRDIGNIDSITTPEGTWAFSDATLGAFPTPLVGASGQVTVRRFSATIIRQIASRNLGLGGLWWRPYNGSNWEAWRQIYDGRTLLGPVAQSSGVPTGAVIERGSNANGNYAKFADGTLICTKPAASFAYLAAGSLRSTWTFPSPFMAGLYGVSASLSTVNGDFVACLPRDFGAVRHGTGATVCDVDIVTPVASMTASSTIVNVRMQAIGRWF